MLVERSNREELGIVGVAIEDPGCSGPAWLIGNWLRGERAESPILDKSPRLAYVPSIQRLVKIVIKRGDFLILHIDTEIDLVTQNKWLGGFCERDLPAFAICLFFIAFADSSTAAERDIPVDVQFRPVL